MRKLVEAVDMILAADLAVVIDVHALGTPSEKKYDKDLHDGANEEAKKLEAAFVENWGALAAALADKDAGRVFFEILNEPVYDKREARWYEIQTKVAAAIRAKAPNHTIIATGTQWGSLSGLIELKPLPDANVVYSFHFYEPMTFTHQGATWGSDNWKHLKSVPYPGTPEAVSAVLDGIKDPAAKGEVKWYGDQGWNTDKIGKRIGKAAAWAKEHGVSVWCGEFGAIRHGAEGGGVDPGCAHGVRNPRDRVVHVGLRRNVRADERWEREAHDRRGHGGGAGVATLEAHDEGPEIGLQRGVGALF
jgi:endoglucanase